ncbi:MAG: LEPR-XLL domain-containing protein, partial [Phycisphaerales bacterium]|nr:LEPR-XLL domain-containing protein [Phycisphaerales bacterium]
MSANRNYLSHSVTSSKSQAANKTNSPLPLMETLEPRLLLSGSVETGIAIEQFVHVYDPIAGEIVTLNDADTPAEAINADIGSSVVWSYVVTNIDQEPLSDFTIIDNHGTPDNPIDDFIPAPVMDGAFNIGDTSQDGLLDVGEQWLYTATDLVEAEGLYTGSASASVSVTTEIIVGGGGGGEAAGFTEYAVLANGAVTIGDYFSVEGGLLGSNTDSVMARTYLSVPTGVRAAGFVGEWGASNIGTLGSEAIIANIGAMLSPGTTINGDIHVGFGPVAMDESALNINGTIYAGADATQFDALDFAPLDDFTPTDPLTPTDDYTPTYDAIYGSVKVLPGETWYLDSGNYYFDSLDFGIGSTLSLSLTSGPISIYVEGGDGTAMDIGTDFTMELTGGGADQVYIEANTNLVAETDIEWYGTVYTSGGYGIDFGSGLELTGALYSSGGIYFSGDMDTSAVNDITFAALDFAAFGIDVGGEGGGETQTVTTVYTDTDPTNYIGILPATDISTFAQKAEALLVQYTGTGGGDTGLTLETDPTQDGGLTLD